jgi:hypothetical protein
LRSIMLLIAVLVAGKFGWQEWSYRKALTDTLLQTFRQDAVESCQKEAANRNLKVAYLSWTKPESVKLVVGRGGADESFWQVSDDMFQTKEASPLIVIVARKLPFKVLCEFDVVRQSAAVYRM